MSRSPLRWLLPLGILLGGVAIALAIVALRPRHADRDPPHRAIPVEVHVARPADVPARVRATGVVTAHRQVTLTPQVKGRLVQVSEQLIPGGRLKRGEVLVRVDPRDYEFAVTRQRAALDQARLELALEENRHRVAAREWQMLGEDGTPEETRLALRQPHLEVARQAVAAEEAALEQARLDLERTAVRAPFDALVIDEQVDRGQVVATTTAIATVVDTDRFRVPVSVPVEQLRLLAIPGWNGEEGSEATVRQDLGGGDRVVRRARILRLGGQLASDTRTATVILVVEDPLDPGTDGLPLLPGAFVHAEISGRVLPGVVPVPRKALHGADTLWLAGARDTLEPRQVRVAWSTDDEIFVAEGLEAGDRVVTSLLSLPVEGTEVEVLSPDDTPSGSPPSSPSPPSPPSSPSPPSPPSSPADERQPEDPS